MSARGKLHLVLNGALTAVLIAAIARGNVVSIVVASIGICASTFALWQEYHASRADREEP